MVLSFTTVEALVGHIDQIVCLQCIRRIGTGAPADHDISINLCLSAIVLQTYFYALQNSDHHFAGSLRTDRRKLVASISESGIAFSHRGLEDFRELQQNLVAGCMSVLIVDHFEMIDIEENER